MRALGLSADELGLLSLCSRALSIPLRPAVALLADKHARHKLVRHHAERGHPDLPQPNHRHRAAAPLPSLGL